MLFYLFSVVTSDISTLVIVTILLALSLVQIVGVNDTYCMCTVQATNWWPN